MVDPGKANQAIALREEKCKKRKKKFNPGTNLWLYGHFKHSIAKLAEEDTDNAIKAHQSYIINT